MSVTPPRSIMPVAMVFRSAPWAVHNMVFGGFLGMCGSVGGGSFTHEAQALFAILL